MAEGCAASPEGSQGLIVSSKSKLHGVRYRSDQKAWIAEMKLEGSKNKVHIMQCKRREQAALAADAAFFHYDKKHLLNFPDSTLHILSARPSSAGLNGKEKLNFVKKEARWLAEKGSIMNRVKTHSACAPSEGLYALFKCDLRTR